ncbi:MULTISPECIES: HAD-IIIC family phosphatase [Butyrivibrio]|uniref:HAD-IIIC family phosphatase n=1 Tax=Butyrivibrio TaxID=830 RepID=UPI0003FB1153|nr:MULTISPECIES: HAD-IIIC family phosphatase [Butyrivibrio]SEP96382.1 HAD-superfamily phosphatase, subfamily IIIC/FkbH-like domain-containing protein [Butyrivibrio sp. TB]
MKELEYPFDSAYILKRSKRIKKQLLEDGSSRIHKKIAVLGGSTTHDIIRIMELFLLDNGIEPEFYESEYGQYWQDAMFPSDELISFAPDIVYIHTSNRNITDYPVMSDDKAQIEDKLSHEYSHFTTMWDKLAATFNCPIIQNNFEAPFYRLLGNRDVFDIHGRLHFVNALNMKLCDYAAAHEGFYINDINYLSSCYGLDAWSDPLYWHMYKYCLCVPAIPYLAFNVANIIKSVYGKNKKALVLDLDNTLWGGVVGDDGVDGIEIGQETNLGQVYSEIQTYLKAQKDIGVMLNVDSKNDEENAIAGLNHPDGVLKPDDFIYIKANWEPKSENFKAIAKSMNILPESMVFVDDNPAEREIIKQQVIGAPAPEIGKPEDYIRVIDHSGFFEVTNLSEDDKKRNDMYKANREREKLEESFQDYGQYLSSLDMKAVIRPFEDLYMARIAQLTNKSNQFNLTTKRFTQEEIAKAAADASNITLYGRLMDKFGDNGIVSLVMGHLENDECHVDLWLMSCRVLKRDMEFAMMDALVNECIKRGIKTIIGYYYPTAKNKMVRDFYSIQGFDRIKEDADGNTIWKLDISSGYENKNRYIAIDNDLK